VLLRKLEKGEEDKDNSLEREFTKLKMDSPRGVQKAPVKKSIHSDIPIDPRLSKTDQERVGKARAMGLDIDPLK